MIIRNSLILISAIIAVLSCVVITQEYGVYVSANAERQARMAREQGYTPKFNTYDVTALSSARQDVERALSIAGQVADHQQHTNQPLNGNFKAKLTVALKLIEHARSARPHWVEAQIAKTYILALQEGPDSPKAIAALIKSYDDSTFNYDSASWRSPLGFAVWSKLPPQTQTRLLIEAVMIARLQPQFRDEIFDAARQSPGYSKFLILWRNTRLQDADTVR